MEILTKEIKANGIKLFMKKGNREIARTYLYLLKNDLHKEPFGFLEDVFVDEEFRGEGLGTTIVTAAIEEAKKQKCYKLICTSRYTKPKVHELYMKLGFQDQGKEFRMDFK